MFIFTKKMSNFTFENSCVIKYSDKLVTDLAKIPGRAVYGSSPSGFRKPHKLLRINTDLKGELQ